MSKITILLVFILSLSNTLFADPSGSTLYIEIKQKNSLLYDIKTYIPLLYENLEEQAGEKNDVVTYDIPNQTKILSYNKTKNAMVTTQDGKEIKIKDYGFSNLIQAEYQLKEKLPNDTLKINYPLTEFVLILVKYTNEYGESSMLTLNEGQNDITLPKIKTSLPKIVINFTQMGVIHILSGFDHLLFILCLCLIIATSYRTLFWTITGFTVSHSITLALTTLNIIDIYPPLVEIFIALSILYLLIEIIFNKKRKRPSFTYKYPAITSTSFGFIHGMGFAQILKEFGIPKDSLITSLLSFNFGIEIGQLIFIASLYTFWYVFKNISFINKKSDSLRTIITYCCLAITVFWIVERTITLF